VWMMKLLGVHNQNRVAGMDIFLALCQEASRQNLSVFFVGSQAEILSRIQTHLDKEFPDLCIAGMEPLPFRPITPEEDASLIRKIHESGASIVFVSLGCPKQEIWMSRHKGRIKGVMIGLGGVFPVYAGIQKRAPQWARESGLEWLYRLLQEPKRLWKRYQSTIPPFIYLAVRQLFHHDRLFMLRSRFMQ
jgi:N-acetylglucosaminyldiphosphoundecaprenol N-acetyl-beta-D-mannosaminyltransferase